MFQCAVWNTWGPVEPVALVAFPSWTDSTIGLTHLFHGLKALVTNFPSWTDSTIGLTHLFQGLKALVTNLNFQPQKSLDLDIPYWHY